VVTKEELRQHVWSGTHVTDTVLRVCIREIRAALDDRATAPQYVETVGGQGYRFCGRDLSGPFTVTTDIVVGRQRELEALDVRFRQAASGQRQCLFLTGEPGVGKTTLVEQWLSRLSERQVIRIGRGKCVAYQEEGEAYRPLLEALSRLRPEQDVDKVLTVLRQYAPMWLVHLPVLVNATEREQVQRQVQGARPARMVRELCDALERLAAEVPLVLVLEDLHWSDNATVGALAALAQGREPARLMVVGTYRSSEAVLRQPALRAAVQELRGHGQCEELPVELLTDEDVAAYASQRLGGPVSTTLTSHLYERTNGNALFMVNVMMYLVQQELVVWRGSQWTLRGGAEAALRTIPEGLRQFILRRIEMLPGEAQRLLQAASVAGDAFAVAAVAAGVQQTLEEVDAACEALAVQSPLLEVGDLVAWPDSTVSGQYRFRHALYRQVVYESIGAARRIQLHRRIGERLESGYGARAPEIAAELALHFERGHVPGSAVQYRLHAGEQALQRHAYQEALGHLRRGLALLAGWPESPERRQQELRLQIQLGVVFLTTRGYGAAETEQAYARALALGQQLGRDQDLFPAHHGSFQYYFIRGNYQTARVIAERLLQLASTSPDATSRLIAHRVMGTVLAWQGELGDARQHLEQCLALYEPAEHQALVLLYGINFKVFALSQLALVLWSMGFPDQAQQRTEEAMHTAAQLAHPFSQAQALNFAAGIQQLCGQVSQTRMLAEAAIALATQHDFPYWLAGGEFFRSWALTAQSQDDNGVAQMQHVVATRQAFGIGVYLPYRLAVLAQVRGHTGQPAAGLALVEEALALVETGGEYVWQAELFRLKGELLLACSATASDEAESCFQEALEVARAQQAKSWELRAATSLARLWQQQGKHNAVHELLDPIYRWFTEGFDTADVQAAAALLQASAC
jgi:predicted ATPase